MTLLAAQTEKRAGREKAAGWVEASEIKRKIIKSYRSYTESTVCFLLSSTASVSVLRFTII